MTAVFYLCIHCVSPVLPLTGSSSHSLCLCSSTGQLHPAFKVEMALSCGPPVIILSGDVQQSLQTFS